MFTKKSLVFIVFTLFAIGGIISETNAQTTVFTYQGKLTDAGNPASGNYLLQFRLYDAISGGTQIGSTLSDVAVIATNGVFTTQLDFGVAAFPGADRFLEIAVKKNTGDPFTTLSPRQQISSSPYSIRTLSAAQADVALDANKLGGIDASEYVTTTSVGSSFIRNATTQQTGNFNIDGNGFLGGNLGVGTTNPQSKLEVNGEIAITPGGTGGQIFFTAPNGETGMLIRGTSRADIRFDGSTLKLLAGISTGAPLSTNGIVISTSGNVGIGTTTPQAKLHVAGNAVQDRDKGGIVKAMLSVSSNGTLERCYNGITGVATGNCGFTITRSANGTYDVSFGFQVSDRFISVTTRPFPPVVLGAVEENTGANFRLSTQNNTHVFVNTFIDAGNSLTRIDAAFMLIVY